MKINKIADSSDFEWYVEPEVFNFISTQFNVEAAKVIIRETPRSIIKMDIRPLERFVGKRPKEEGSYKLSPISVNWDKMDNVDLSMPVIVAQKGNSTLPIDGWHRIAKALESGLEELPAVLLTKEETREIAGG
jgi:hypothetical protein